ncbi:hypothetical protein BJX62DRAFT_117272 [Aspergillus germanicus]
MSCIEMPVDLARSIGHIDRDTGGGVIAIGYSREKCKRTKMTIICSRTPDSGLQDGQDVRQAPSNPHCEGTHPRRTITLARRKSCNKGNFVSWRKLNVIGYDLHPSNPKLLCLVLFAMMLATCSIFSYQLVPHCCGRMEGESLEY